MAPTVVAPVQCSLPPLPVLPTPAALVDEERQLACLDEKNAVLAIVRDARLRRWAREACARCGCGESPRETQAPADGGIN